MTGRPALDSHSFGAYRDIDVGGQPGGAVQEGALGAEQVPRHAGLLKRVRGVGEKFNDR